LTWIDLLPIVLVIAYGVGGYFTGLIRRFIGLVALFVSVWAATNMGLQAGAILTQTSTGMVVSDSRIYGFFGIIVALLLIVEVATQIAHKQIQIPGAIILNRTLGVVFGLATAILLSVVVIYEVGQAANPIGGAQLDPLQQGLRDAVHHSLYATNLVNAIDRPIVALFQPLLPGDPQVYFSSAVVNP
jgi:uncharacterized membrane protein required for colicin V production